MYEWVQPSLTLPHDFPAHAVACGIGVQPHAFGVPPPPQVSPGAVHVTPPFAALQLTAVPQLSLTIPHFPAHVVETG
jgi:hypothetical protein